MVERPPLSSRSRLLLWFGLMSVGLALLAGCGSGGDARHAPKRSDPSSEPSAVQWLGRMQPIPGVVQHLVGGGPRAAVVLWKRGGERPHQVVVFLHGWLPRPPSSYGTWLHHLVDEGNTVIYPVYQSPRAPLAAPLANALAGIATGLDAVHADPRRVVAIGHTTGGVLAFEYAAVASDHQLPVPRAVLAVYPGRYPGADKDEAVDLSGIPAYVRVAVIGGPGDPLPDGNHEARMLLSGAARVRPTRRTFLVAPPTPAGTPAPARILPRPLFWHWADRLIAQGRRGPPNGVSP